MNPRYEEGLARVVGAHIHLLEPQRPAGPLETFTSSEVPSGHKVLFGSSGSASTSSRVSQSTGGEAVEVQAHGATVGRVSRPTAKPGVGSDPPAPTQGRASYSIGKFATSRSITAAGVAIP